MKYIAFIIVAVTLTACGEVNVKQMPNDIKRIELSNVGKISWPPELAYALPESQMLLASRAMQECPNGYQKLKEQYVPDSGDGHDMMVWEVKCLNR